MNVVGHEHLHLALFFWWSCMALAFRYCNGTDLQTSSVVILFHEKAGVEQDDYAPWTETVWSNKKGGYVSRTVRLTAAGAKQLLEKRGEFFAFVDIDSDDERQPVSQRKPDAKDYTDSQLAIEYMD